MGRSSLLCGGGYRDTALYVILVKKHIKQQGKTTQMLEGMRIT